MINKIKSFTELSKLKIMIPVSLTGFTGFFLFDPHISINAVLVTIGILLLSISASVLNQIQEADLDKMMERTHNRPLPSKTIGIKIASIFFFVNLFSGTFLIYSAGTITAALIGLFTIVWYNGIYTYLKRITAFAVFPGAVTGALPPVIGWVAAGGAMWDKPIIFLAFLIFMGQIPHFWLLMLKYGEDYKQAGFPGLYNIFTQTQIYRLTFSWVVSSVIAALFLGYFEIIKHPVLLVILLIASIYIIWQFSNLLKVLPVNKDYRKYSRILDLYFFLVLILLISDRILTVLR